MGERYGGLDVSDKLTHICVLDGAGALVWRGRCASEAEVIAATLRQRAPGLRRAVIETGPWSGWLVPRLREHGLPAVCICARHAKRVLAAQGHKSDVRDAEGLAQLARTGWYRAVHVKQPAAQQTRAMLGVRERLVRIRRDLVNQLRGLLRGFGLRLGQVTTDRRLMMRLATLTGERAELARLVQPLLAVHAATGRELDRLDEQVEARAAADPVCRRLMTVPGVGGLTALAFVATVDDPKRFAKAAQVGAYLGLVPRQFQSGEVDINGALLKRGDKMLRHLLYEAANSILGRLKRDCGLRRWGLALQERVGAKCARVGVARKLAALLHRLWQHNEEFRWQTV